MKKCNWKKGCLQDVIGKDNELCFYHRKVEAGLIDKVREEQMFIFEKNELIEAMFQDV